MAELRWILLLAGLVFLAGLTVWEMRRPRQGRGDALARPERSEPTLGVLSEMEQATAALAPLPSGYTRQPAHAGAPEPYDVRDTRATRVPLEDPVQVELPPIERPPIEPPLVISFDEPVLPHPQEAFKIDDERHDEHSSPIELPVYAMPSLHAADEPRPAQEQHYEQQHYQEQQYAQEHDASLPLDPQPVTGDTAESVDPIVDWPPEEQRHILAVRVVGLNPDRMSGRPLRQALSACGFVHGRFGIFHQPGADGRALISAANLNKPGVFDPASMDFQRFRGLGLFAVLPGPLPPAAALDHLLDTAGDLAQRLHARLQDEHGMPLDEERLEGMARIVQSMSQSGLRAEPAA